MDEDDERDYGDDYYSKYDDFHNQEWNWEMIESECLSNHGRCYLGSWLNLAPSGKIYAPWTSNQKTTILSNSILIRLRKKGTSSKLGLRPQ